MPVYDKLVRDNIKNMQSYASARGTAKAMQGFALLDAAENPYCAFSEDEDGAKYTDQLNRYPEPQPLDVLEGFAKLYGVSPESIFLSRGSEEAIRLLIQLFCRPEKEAMITCPPTFALYQIEAAIHDVENIKTPRLGELRDHLDIDAICEQGKKENVKIIFICNPGNPASTAIPSEEVEEVISNLVDDCMVVVDEAYIDFAEHESFVSKLDKYPNLIVMRTLSKSYGAAGLRCGTTVAHPQVVTYLRKIMSAYPVPRPVENIAAQLLTDSRLEYMQEKQNIIKEERSRIIAALNGCSSVKKVFPSQSNFICAVVDDAPACVKLFYENKIIIRDRSSGIPNTVNIAVGLKAQNDKVIELFKQMSK